MVILITHSSPPPPKKKQTAWHCLWKKQCFFLNAVDFCKSSWFSKFLAVTAFEEIQGNIGSLPNKKSTREHSWFYNSKLSIWICTTDDSRTVGIPISFMYPCIKFVICWPTKSCNKQRTWQLSWWGHSVWCFTIPEAVRHTNQMLPNIYSILTMVKLWIQLDKERTLWTSWLYLSISRHIIP